MFYIVSYIDVPQPFPLGISLLHVFYTVPGQGKICFVIIHTRPMHPAQHRQQRHIHKYNHESRLDDLTNVDMGRLPRLGILLEHVAGHPDLVAGAVHVPSLEGVH